MDLVTIINFILALLIFVMGIWEYTRNKSMTVLYIGIAFGLFAVSHLLTLLGMAASLSVVLIVIRILAYLLVIYALYLIMAKKKA